MADLSIHSGDHLALDDLASGVRRAFFEPHYSPPVVIVTVDGRTVQFGYDDAARLGRWLLAICQPDVRVVCAECPR